MLKKWVEDHYDDFDEDPKLRKSLRQLTSNMMKVWFVFLGVLLSYVCVVVNHGCCVCVCVCMCVCVCV